MRKQVVRGLALVLLSAPLYADVYSAYLAMLTGQSPTTTTTTTTSTASSTPVNTTSSYYGFNTTGATSSYSGSYTNVASTAPSAYTNPYTALLASMSGSNVSYIPQYTSTTPVATSTPTASNTWTSTTSSVPVTSQQYAGSAYLAMLMGASGQAGVTYSYQQPPIPGASAIAASPEPGTIAMMVGGLGLLGLVARRRKR